MATETIFVKAADESGRVALWEKHPSHPDGEVFIAGTAVVEVAKTPDVLERLSRGVLVEVTKTGKEKTAASATGGKGSDK